MVILMLLFAAAWAAADYDMLVRYAELTLVAYCLDKGLGPGNLASSAKCPVARCHNLDVEVVHTFDSEECSVGSGYVAVDHAQRQVYVVFRGSTSTSDWLQDFEVTPVPYHGDCDGCLVHQGFYRYIKSDAFGELFDLVTNLHHSTGYPLLVMGHSLGGALAALSGLEFGVAGMSTLIVTYASPKFGNRCLMDYFDEVLNTEGTLAQAACHNLTSGYVRVTHKNDWIPYLPPLYEHGGYEYHINKKKLPHPESAVERRGTHYSGFLSAVRPSKLAPSALGRKEHVRYFLKLSGCKD